MKIEYLHASKFGNGAMVAALGERLVAVGAPPSPLDLPADSAMPVEVVVR